MTIRKRPGKRKSDPESDSIETNIFNPLKLPKQINTTLYDDGDDYLFTKLQDAINMRAADFPLQHQFPRMDLTALYCLATIVKEYTRHLGTDLITQKRASQKLSPLNTHFTPDEIEARQIPALIKKYKKPDIPLQRLPKIEYRQSFDQDSCHQIRKKKSSMNIQAKENVAMGDTKFEKILRQPEWKGVLRKIKDPEAAAATAKLQRVQSEKKAEKLKKEQALKTKFKKEPVIIKQEIIFPPTPPADIFDIASSKKFTSKKSLQPAKKKRKEAKSIF